nr:DJ-1/PfpI family protein [uncultured Chryseobacterium sp.]
MKLLKTFVITAFILSSTVASKAQISALQEMKKVNKKINVAFLMYDNVEAMDLNGPVDVFAKAQAMDPGYNLYTVAGSTEDLIPSEGNVIKMKPTYSFKNAPQADILIIPGAGPETLVNVTKNSELLEWIKKQNKNTKLTMSVCTGALILSNAGVLDGKKATTHYLALDELKQNPKINIVDKVRFVEDGKIITAAGITSGLDSSLYLIERVNGKDVADKIAKLFVYNRNGDMSFMEDK